MCSCIGLQSLAVNVQRWMFTLDLHRSRFLISYAPGSEYVRSSRGTVFKALCPFHKQSFLHPSCSVSFGVPKDEFNKPDLDIAKRKAAEWCCSAFKYLSAGDHINHKMPAQPRTWEQLHAACPKLDAPLVKSVDPPELWKLYQFNQWWWRYRCICGISIQRGSICACGLKI